RPVAIPIASGLASAATRRRGPGASTPSASEIAPSGRAPAAGRPGARGRHRALQACATSSRELAPSLRHVWPTSSCAPATPTRQNMCHGRGAREGRERPSSLVEERSGLATVYGSLLPTAGVMRRRGAGAAPLKTERFCISVAMSLPIPVRTLRVCSLCGHLVAVNREIATRTIPALRLAASVREGIAPLMRLEARAVVLGDARYATAWAQGAARVTQDLERLADYAQSQWESLHLREARVAFEGYRRTVAEE